MPIEIETYRSACYPWHCDSMGHMNTQFYVTMFDAASGHLLSRLAPTSELEPVRRGWADVRQLIEYRHEVRSGGLVHIVTRLTRVGTKSVEYLHSLMSSESGKLHATSANTTVLFDLVARKALVLDERIRERGRALGVG